MPRDQRHVAVSHEDAAAILAGRKRQLRRVIGFQPPAGAVQCYPPDEVHARWTAMDGGTNIVWMQACPFGAPGQVLSVREPWAYGVHAMAAARDEDGPFVYQADGQHARQHRLCERWRPAVNMPPWASRQSIKLAAVRVERLQDIGQADALAEGAPPSGPSIDSVSRSLGYADFQRSWFAQTWDAMRGRGAWQANPWVWVLDFERA